MSSRIESLVSSYGTYPSNLTTALQQSKGIFPENLVELKFDQRRGVSDYVQYLMPMDMGDSSVLRFKDSSKRPGIAVLIEGYAEGKVGNSKVSIKSIKTIVSIFQRYAKNSQENPHNKERSSIWTYHCRDRFLVRRAYFLEHEHKHTEKDCQTCPPFNSGDSGAWFQGILDGTDPLFQLSGDIKDSKGNLVSKKQRAVVEEIEKKIPEEPTATLALSQSSSPNTESEPTTVDEIAAPGTPAPSRSPSPDILEPLLATIGTTEEIAVLSKPPSPITIVEQPETTTTKPTSEPPVSLITVIQPPKETTPPPSVPQPQPSTKPTVVAKTPPLSRFQKFKDRMASGWKSFCSAIGTCFRWAFRRTQKQS